MVLRAVAKNAAWLGLLQVLNYAVPIVTLPVVTRAFGLQLFGEISVVQAYTFYGALIVGFGFSITGPRDVACAKGDRAVISRFSPLHSTRNACFLWQVVLVTRSPLFLCRRWLRIG